MLSAVKHLRNHLFFDALTNIGAFGIRWYQSSHQKPYLLQSELQDLEQTAIISFYTMEHIRDLRLKPNSQFEKKFTFTKEAIIKKINQRAAQLKKNNMIIGSWALKQHNIDKVWEGFDDNIGAKINVDIWRQSRFMEIAINQRITLMPTHVTGQVFDQLLICYQDSNRLKQIIKNKFVIYGEKGTGKSFAFFIYDYLSQFIINFRMKMKDSDLEPTNILKFMTIEQLKHIKKILYFPLKQIEVIKKAIKQLSLQGYQGIEQGITESRQILYFSQILKRITQFYKKPYQIEIMCIIDQANYYYSCFRKMLEFIQNKDPENPKLSNNDIFTYNVLNNHSIIMKYISRYVEDMVFNSSQSIDPNLITFWNSSSKKPQYFDIYYHQKSTIADHQIQYSASLDSNAGQLILYEIFWEQLCHSQLRYTNQNIMRKDPKLRTIFLSSFGISDSTSNNAQTSQGIQIFWGLDVRHLNIRTICTKKQLLNNLFALINQGSHNIQNNQNKIEDQLIRLKNLVETERYEEIKSKFNAYLNKSISDLADSARFKIICWINQQAYYAMKEQDNDLNDIYPKEDNATSQEEIHTLQQFTKNDGRGYKVEIDFDQIMKSELQKNKSSLTQKQIISITNQINTFIQEVGIGFCDKVKPNKCCFSIDPAILWKITLLLEEDLTENSTAQLQLLIKKIKVARYNGNYMNIIYYKLFAFNKPFTLYADKFQKGNSLQIVARIQYNISTCFQFSWRQTIAKLRSIKKTTNPQNKVNLAEQLQNLFLKANQKDHYGQFVLGYPVKKNRFNQTDLAPNNPLFDFILVCAYNKNSEKCYKIHSIDVGVGQLANKAKDKKKAKLQYVIQQILKMPLLKGINPKNIQYKHLILSPEHQVIKFKEQYLLKSFTDMMRRYVNDITIIIPDGIDITYGIISANYFIKNKHLSFPENFKNQQNVFFSTMSNVMLELNQPNR